MGAAGGHQGLCGDSALGAVRGAVGPARKAGLGDAGWGGLPAVGGGLAVGRGLCWVGAVSIQVCHYVPNRDSAWGGTYGQDVWTG